jgi:hypothetical protein
VLTVEGEVAWSTFEQTGDCGFQCQPADSGFVAPGPFSATVVIDPTVIAPAPSQPADGDRWSIDAIAPTSGNSWTMPPAPLHLFYTGGPVERGSGLFYHDFHFVEQRFGPAGPSWNLEAKVWADVTFSGAEIIWQQETLFLNSPSHPSNPLVPGQLELSDDLLQSLEALEFTFESHGVMQIGEGYEVHDIIQVGGPVTHVELAPEPSAGALLVSGLVLLSILRRRRSHR